MTAQGYFRVLARWWWLFVLCLALLGGAAAGLQWYLGTLFVYKATATVTVGTEVGGFDQSNQELTLADSLVTTYAELAKRQPITNRVVNSLNLGIGTGDLVAYHLEVTEIEGTALIEITGKHGDPATAQAIANETARQLQALAPARPTRLIQIVSQAQRPETLDLESFLLIALASVVGLLLAGGIVLLVEFALDRPYTPEWASTRLELPILGKFNSGNAPGRPRLFGNAGAEGALTEPVWWVVMNTMERAHESVISSNGAGPAPQRGKAIVVTSAEPKDSKAAAATALAHAAAASGLRTILVDADVRRSRWQKRTELERWFRQDGHDGITNLAQNGYVGQDLEKYLVPGDIDGLRVLPAGPKLDIGGRIVHDHFWQELLNDLRAEADLVVINAPAVKDAPEAMPMVAKADGVIMTMDLGHTSSAPVNETAEILAKAGATVLGVVLNEE